LGGEVDAPIGALILGGLSGIQQRYAHGNVQQQADCLRSAMAQGEAGVNFVLTAGLIEGRPKLKWLAYDLLQSWLQTEASALRSALRSALLQHHPYRAFQCIKTIASEVQRDRVEHVALNRAGNRLVVGYRSGLAQIQALPSLQTLYSFDIRSQRNLIRSLQHDGQQLRWLGLSADEQSLITSSLYGTVTVWSLLLNEAVRTLQGYASSCVVTPEERLLGAATTMDGAMQPHIQIGNLKTGRQVQVLEGTELVNALALGIDGKTLYSGHDKGYIQVWDLATGEMPTVLHHPSWVHALAVHPQQPWLYSAGGGLVRDYSIQVWDLTTGKVRQTIEGHGATVRCLAVSSNGQLLVSGGDDGQVRLWDLATGERLATLTGHWEMVKTVAVTPDCRSVISGGYDGTVRFWATESG
jgi:COMPASS component SWD3